MRYVAIPSHSIPSIITTRDKMRRDETREYNLIHAIGLGFIEITPIDNDIQTIVNFQRTDTWY